jgi:peptidoglycan/LPS O-acetylase OafA/YrhL
VLYSHTYFIGGYGAEPFHAWTKSQAIVGELSVLGFFGLSGYLVTASYTRSHGLRDYLEKRIRRIVPGLWVCLIVSAFVIAPAIFSLSHGTLNNFPWLRGEGSALHYVMSNLAIRVSQWSISGVLSTGPYGGSLNGSLWSLWPETLCYLLVAALGLAGALERNRLLLLIGASSLFILHAAHTLVPSAAIPVVPTWLVLTDRAPYFLSYLIGTILWLCRDTYSPGWPAALLIVLALGALGRFGGLHLLAPVFVPIALIFGGRCFRFRLSHDVSYGLYIYGFPAQQLLATTPLTSYPWWLFFAASVALTTLFAFLSWRFVERPFLNRRASHP